MNDIAMTSHTGVPHSTTFLKPRLYTAKNATTDANIQNMTLSYRTCADDNILGADLKMAVIL